MYQKQYTRISLDDIEINDPLVDNFLSRSGTMRVYQDTLSRKGLGADDICLYKGALINLNGSSHFWAAALKEMKAHGSEAPDGVTVEDDRWMIQVCVINPCGECKAFAGRKCYCFHGKQ